MEEALSLQVLYLDLVGARQEVWGCVTAEEVSEVGRSQVMEELVNYGEDTSG